MGVAGAAMAAGAFAMTRQQEVDVLKQQADQAAGVLERLRQRISELEAGAEK